MEAKKRKISKKGQACVNHPDNYNTEECERCNSYFCSDCYIEDWHETFFGQFIGQKREMVKTIYCLPCRKRVIRVRMIAYSGVLILISLPFIITILMIFL